MREPVFSPMAVEDLDGIVEYIARDNPPAAVRFVEALKEKCYTLARFPLLGTSRERITKGCGRFQSATTLSTTGLRKTRYVSSGSSMGLGMPIRFSARLRLLRG